MDTKIGDRFFIVHDERKIMAILQRYQVNYLVSIFSGVIVAISVIYFPNAAVFAVIAGLAFGAEAWNFSIYFSQQTNFTQLIHSVKCKQIQECWKEISHTNLQDRYSWIFADNTTLADDLRRYFYDDLSAKSAEDLERELKDEKKK